MGACYDTVFVNESDKQKALQKFEDIVDQDRYENGHCYSGTIGMCDGVTFTNEVFDSAISAETWVEASAEKWGPALAVKLENEERGLNGWLFGAICPS